VIDLGKLHRDVMLAIVRMKVPIDDIKQSIFKKILDEPNIIPQILNELDNLKHAIEYKIRELEISFNLE